MVPWNTPTVPSPGCPEYNTTYHPCTYPFLTLPNATAPCTSTFADAQKGAYDASRLLYLALGALVLGRYMYLMWYIARLHCCLDFCDGGRRGGGSTLGGRGSAGGAQKRVTFGATDKGAVCGFAGMVAWMVRALDVQGARGVVPFWLDDQLIVFIQDVLITALILSVRSWLATISFTPGRTGEGRGGVALFWVSMIILWGVHFLLLTPMQVR